MTFPELQSYVMHQTNNDVEDLGDFMPYLAGYLNDGYDRLINAYAGAHVGDSGYPLLAAVPEAGEGEEQLPDMVPNLPVWTHQAIADWATWLVYRNGNPTKQQRGLSFRASAEEVASRVRASGGLAGDTARAAGQRIEQFKNIPFYPYG